MPQESFPNGPQVEGRAPASIPDHELVRLIGKGSYGEVWLARNTLGTFRAVKVVYAQTFRHKSPFDREFRGVERFEPVSRLHDGLVDILQVGRNEAAGYFYCVMELADDAVSGLSITPSNYTPRTLACEVAKQQRLPLPECLHIGERIAAALGFLHERGLIHRDVKPSNIIFVNGAPKLADVGLVAELADARSFVGTDGFIPPEGPGSISADVYSLGKVLYEISTGKDRRDYPELPTRVDDGADEQQFADLNRIILKACRAAPKQRYQSAEKLRTDLIALQRGERFAEKRPPALRFAWAVAVVLASLAGLHWFRHGLGPSASAVRPPGLVGLWSAEGNGLDSAGTNDGVLYGVAFVPGRVGRAFDFVPPSHRLRIPDNRNFELTNSLTIEAWVFIRTGQGFIFHRGDSRPGLDPYSLGAVGPGQILFNLNQSLTNYLNLLAPITYRQWEHVAATLDGDSGEAKIYVDGKLVTQTNTAIRPLGELDPAYAPSIGIGNIGPLNNNYCFDGLVDEVALYSRALTVAEVRGLYRAGRDGKAVPPANPSPPRRPEAQPRPSSTAPVPAPRGLVGWWRAEGDAADALGANPGNASPGLSFAPGLVGQAFRFNGSNAFVKIPRAPALDPGSEVTLEFWMKADLDNPMNTCCQGLVGSDFYNIEISSSVETLTGPNFGVSSDGRTFVDTSEANNRAAMISSGDWHHVAGTYDGTRLQLYIDGKAWGKPTAHTGAIPPMLPASSLAIGSEDGRSICPECNGTRYFKGLIDEVSFYTRALPAKEIEAIYAAGSAGKALRSP